jgi:Carboxypeptidase regulatory-like domain
MKAATSIMLWLAITSSTLFGQSSLAGKIIDYTSAEELIAANVTIFKNGKIFTGVASDFEGNYSLLLDPGFYEVEVSYVGYASFRISGVAVSADRINLLSVGLGGNGGKVIKPDGERHSKRKVAPVITFPFISPAATEGVVIELLDNEPVLDK